MLSSTELLIFAAWMAVMLVLMRRRAPVGLAIVVGAVGLAASRGHGPAALVGDLRRTLTNGQVLELLVVIIEIYLLSALLDGTGRMRRIADVLNRSLRDRRWLLVSLPALVGLLPMPGGAMFTAPLTEQVGQRLGLSAELKVFSNYWFRHCWEWMLPLYPGLILAASLCKIPLAQAALALAPFTVVAFVAGWLTTFGRTTRADADDDRGAGTAAASLAWREMATLWPIVGVVGLALLRVPVIAALGIVVIGLAWREGVGWREAVRYARVACQGWILLLIVAVFFFSEVMNSTGLMAGLGVTMRSWGLPLWLLSFALPFAMALLTGTAVAFVGTVFPVLVPLWGQDVLVWLQWAYVAGLAGVMLTPAHLCLSMTQEYFHARLGGVMRLLVVPTAVVVLASGLRLAWGP